MLRINLRGRRIWGGAYTVQIAPIPPQTLRGWIRFAHHMVYTEERSAQGDKRLGLLQQSPSKGEGMVLAPLYGGESERE